MNRKGKGKAPVNYGYGPMILLDPGSHAFDHPAQYGYRLRFKNLVDYIEGHVPSVLAPVDFVRDQVAATGSRSQSSSSTRSRLPSTCERSTGPTAAREADTARLCFVTANKLAMDVVDDAMSLDEGERSKRLKAFSDSLDSQLGELSPRS